MAKKQVTVNEEMIRGIMAGDIPNYGKDISVDDVITTDESDGNECEADNPGPVTVEKSTGKPKKRKDVTDSYRKEFLSGGNVFREEMFCKGSRLISVSTIIGLYRNSYRL